VWLSWHSTVPTWTRTPANTDTDFLADILARIVARMSAFRWAYDRNNFRKSRVSDVSARILARMPEQVLSVVLVDFGERHNTRTNGLQHYTQQTILFTVAHVTDWRFGGLNLQSRGLGGVYSETGSELRRLDLTWWRCLRSSDQRELFRPSNARQPVTGIIWLSTGQPL